MKFLHAFLLAASLSFSLLPSTAIAGFDEGLAAYEKQDYATALREFKQLATQGNANAQYCLGVMYANGQGVPQDYKEAVKWYRLAIDQGNAHAQNKLGWMYESGQGVPQDYKEAVKWYRLAVDQGVLSRNRRKFRQPINVACPAPGRWGRPNSRVTSRHFDHGNASRTSRPDCSGLDEAD